MRLLPVVFPVAVVVLGACSETGISLALPRLDLSDEAFVWDELPLGVDEARTVGLSNLGRGNLQIEGFALIGDAPAVFEVVPPEPTTLEPDGRLDLTVRLLPDTEGEIVGAVELLTNDPARPVVELPLQGFATDPVLDLDPTLLSFGVVAPGSEATQELRFDARGTGTVEVTGVTLEDVPEDGVYALVLPEGLAFPLRIPAGTGVNTEVVFRPVDAQTVDSRLVADSVTPTHPPAQARLIGNSAIEPGDNLAPIITLFQPSAGSVFLTDETVTVTAIAVDADHASDELTVLVFAGATLLGQATPDADGNVAFSASDLPAGELELLVSVTDPLGAKGEDAHRISVFEPDSPVPYVISGGPSPTQSWFVDDDVEIFVDGVPVFSDTNTVRDTHAPVSFLALRGSTIRIVATDAQSCEAKLDALTLHFGTGYAQPMNSRVCVTGACSPNDPCYDPTFTGPWPAVVLDDTYVIAIP